MKPVYLEFSGVNSFSERAEIDFEKLLEFGIFGIFGDTGSGKSTILDCIVFALYGKVSRLDSKDAVIANLINYHSDRAYVNFEFEIEYGGKRRRYRVERELKRKNSVQNARVYEKKGETLFALAEGTRDSNTLLETVIGLEQRDFEKCIALPQGEFAQFVKSQRSDRLKLISRLFDLERYGEGLTKRINKRYSDAQREAEVLKARLEPFEGITEAGIRGLKSEIARVSEEEKRAAVNLTAAQEAEKKLTALFERKKEFDRAVREAERLEGAKADMSKLNDELSRLEKASAAIAALKEEKVAKERSATIARKYALAQADFRKAEESRKVAEGWDPAKAAEEIAALTERVAVAARAEADEATALDYNRKLTKILREYDEEAALFLKFDYEGERKKGEEKLASLGDGNFFGYADRHGKAALLRGEYAEFAGELSSLTEKYPQISKDSEPLIAKYRELSAGDRTTFSDIRKDFEMRECEREKVREELRQLDKAKGRYEAHVANLTRLQAEIKEWRARIAALPSPQERGISAKELGEQLTVLRERQQVNTEKRERVAKAYSDAQSRFAIAEERRKNAEEQLSEASRRLFAALTAGGFANADEAEALSRRYGDPSSAREKVEKYREDYASAKRRLRELSAEDYSSATENALSAARETLSEAQRAGVELARAAALKSDELRRAERDILQKKELTALYTEKHKEAELCERLKKLLEGNKFMEFVAEEYLQTVARNASGRLLSLTDGRYFLRYENGFVVGDNFNGGAVRGVFTLSGGETFLVSLSLALALGAEICLRSLRPIEFFFLDEGFGTLDEKLVDTVMDSLEKLKGEHFSIGIISHVEELRHRIERRLSVKKATERHGSQITLE